MVIVDSHNKVSSLLSVWKVARCCFGILMCKNTGREPVKCIGFITLRRLKVNSSHAGTTSITMKSNIGLCKNHFISTTYKNYNTIINCAYLEDPL